MHSVMCRNCSVDCCGLISSSPVHTGVMALRQKKVLSLRKGARLAMTTVEAVLMSRLAPAVVFAENEPFSL